MNLNINGLITAWLNQHPDDRDIEYGANLLLQLSGDPINHRIILANPEKYAGWLEKELRKYYEERISCPEAIAAAKVEEKIKPIVKRNNLDVESKEQKTEAEKIKGGRRADHDQLPEEIQQLYVDNGVIRRRMQQTHLRIRMALGDGQDCKELVKELKADDVLMHENWKKYDSYQLTDKNE